jgi:3-phenylpropionate/trans-cinnamate dioxygenase ferredoxin subunit
MNHDWIDVAKVGEIPKDESKIIDLNGDEVAVYNLAGEYFAIEDVCTHDGGDLSGGWVEDGAAVCPRHLAKFDIKTGEVLAPPAYENVHAFPVRVAASVIQVRDDRED